ncbi:MAG: nucleotidyltransferase family protein [Pseudomonadota bacterium]
MNGPALTPDAARYLCELADPAAPRPPTGPDAFFSPAELAELCAYHAMETVAWRKLNDTAETMDRYATLGETAHAATILTLLLEGHAQKIRRAFDDAGLEWTFVKGAAFASELYAEMADRPYTDLDILVPKSAMAQARDVLKAAGYRHIERQRPDKDGVYEEEKWMPVGEQNILIELHTDLVHQPALRKRVSFNYDAFKAASGHSERSPIGHLMTAIVHGALGHKFHQLKLAVDILQAMRAIDENDVDAALGAARQLKVRFELAASARLVQSLFPTARHNEVIYQFANAVKTPAIINRSTVVNAHLRDHLPSRIRRHAFRWYQRTMVFS